jgi:uncharacterized protein (DUF2249 family)
MHERPLIDSVEARTVSRPARLPFVDTAMTQAPEPTRLVDARGLEPPQPLVAVLEALARLGGGEAMRARTDRRPLHLYPLLEQRGFTGETAQEPDGSFLTIIRRK